MKYPDPHRVYLINQSIFKRNQRRKRKNAFVKGASVGLISKMSVFKANENVNTAIGEIDIGSIISNYITPQEAVAVSNTCKDISTTSNSAANNIDTNGLGDDATQESYMPFQGTFII